MRKIVRELAWACYSLEGLYFLLIIGNAIVLALAIGIGIAKSKGLFIIIGVPLFVLTVIFLTIVDEFSTNEKNPKIAIAEAQKILKENLLYNDPHSLLYNPRLNLLIEKTKQEDDSTNLAKWLESHRKLHQKRQRLSKVKEKLFYLNREEWTLETQIKHLKSDLGFDPQLKNDFFDLLHPLE